MTGQELPFSAVDTCLPEARSTRLHVMDSHGQRWRREVR